ncbi:MAG: hypothetical protein ACP5QP_04775 [Brevinematia bacterium]
MKRFFVVLFFMVSSLIAFGAVKPFVDAYFSTSLFQNVDSMYLREHYGPYNYGYQYGDNRIYLRDSRLSFIFGLGVKEENLFGSVDLYVNSFIDASTYLDINSAIVGYSDETFTVEGFFKSRAIRMRNLPSEVFFNFMPSLQLFSSSFSRGHWFVPYFLYPIEFLDGSVEVLSTAMDDTTNLVLSGRDYYGIYGSYFDGIIDIEGYFAKNIYDSTTNLQNAKLFGNLSTGNYGAVRIGGAGNIGIGDVYIGGVYKSSTSNTLYPYSKDPYYRFFFYLPMIPLLGSSNTYYYSIPIYLNSSFGKSFNMFGGYLSFDMSDFVFISGEGGILGVTTYVGTNKFEDQNIYVDGGIVFKGLEGSKVELSGVLVSPSKSNLSMMGLDIKGAFNYFVSLFTDQDELKTLIKIGVRDMKIAEPLSLVTSLVGLGNVGYRAGDISVDLLGYANNNSISYSYSSVSLFTNLFYSDVRLYIGYNIASIIKSKDLGKDLWLKIGGRSVVQVGNVNWGNVGENTILTPYIGIWYTIPNVNSYISISYGWYGMTSVNDLDLGRGLESTLIMYNGGDIWNGGLIMADNLASTVYSDGKLINTGEYKLAVEPVVRFDMYIRY